MAAPCEPLPVDTYRVRWPLSVSGLADIKEAGQQVKVTDIVSTKDVTINGKTVTIKGLAQTAAGPVPCLYLEPKQKRNSKLEEKVFNTNPVHGDVASGQWWLGRISAIEAGILLAKDPALVMGNYAVCQPPVCAKCPISTFAKASNLSLAENNFDVEACRC